MNNYRVISTEGKTSEYSDLESAKIAIEALRGMFFEMFFLFAPNGDIVITDNNPLVFDPSYI